MRQPNVYQAHRPCKPIPLLNTNSPLQSANNDHCSVTTDGSGDGDGDVEIRPLDDRHPPSSACTLFLALSLLVFHFGYLIPCVRVGEQARLCIYIWHLSPGAPGALTELLCHPMMSWLPPFQSTHGQGRIKKRKIRLEPDSKPDSEVSLHLQFLSLWLTYTTIG